MIALMGACRVEPVLGGADSTHRIQLPSSLQSMMLGHVFNRNVEVIQPPSSLQSLTCGNLVRKSLGGIRLPSTLLSMTLGYALPVPGGGSLQSLLFGYEFQPEPGGNPTAQQPAEFVWLFVRPEPGKHPTTQQPSKFAVWSTFQQTLGGIHPLQSLEGIQLPS